MPPKRSRPRRYMTGFMVYCKAHRSDIEGMSPQDAVRELAARWRELQDKSEYLERSEKDKQRWKREMRTYHKRVRMFGRYGVGFHFD